MCAPADLHRGSANWIFEPELQRVTDPLFWRFVVPSGAKSVIYTAGFRRTLIVYNWYFYWRYY